MTENCKAWIAANRQNIVQDIKRVVDIKSVKDAPLPDAPYGAGVRAVQLEAMAMCREAGLEVVDVDGRIAYAHYGDPDRFIGIIAHLDVVPEGTGWDSDPYDMTVRDGYLVGRGVADDKGPFVLALWAVRYLIEHKVPLNYGVRLILGLDEETGMSDVQYYNEHCAVPVFTFTPDADFPVCHGEKGIYGADLVSPAIQDRVVRDLRGGVASNVVPDTAVARVDGSKAEELKAAADARDNITAADEGGDVVVTAKGLARHAGDPHGGVSAIYELLAFLLDAGVLSGEEKKAAEFMRTASGDFSGAQFGINADDGLFDPVTMIAGTVNTRDDRFILNVNSRYNTALTPAKIEQRVAGTANETGFDVQNVSNSKPHYLPPETPAVQLLTAIYNELTGRDEKPYVMSGGTYARYMPNAVAYGIEIEGMEMPAWAGQVHMKNEAVGVEHAMTACEIYINTLVRLQNVDFGAGDKQ